MFCPNCGNDCGDANFCSNCGYNLKGAVITVSTADSELDERTQMIHKYEKYMPNKLAAVKALREDTGMGLKEAVDKINELFDSNAEKTGQVYCPRCHSASISAHQKGFSFTRGAIGTTVGLDVGLIAGGIGSKKVVCTCLKCGYQWKAGKR